MPLKIAKGRNTFSISKTVHLLQVSHRSHFQRLKAASNVEHRWPHQKNSEADRYRGGEGILSKYRISFQQKTRGYASRQSKYRRNYQVRNAILKPHVSAA